MAVQEPMSTTTTPSAGAVGSDRIILSASELPTRWYNVLPDLPFPLSPPISPATGAPVTFDELSRIFPPGLIAQEMSAERMVEIRAEVLEILSMWRPTPLIRARRLERALRPNQSRHCVRRFPAHEETDAAGDGRAGLLGWGAVGADH